MNLFRRKKPATNPPAATLDNNLCLNSCPTQQGTLALPTNLEEVVQAAHTGVPRYLPGDEAEQDEVRYFLYQVLTLNEHKIAQAYPQWVLETCMHWNGNGSKLRSLPIDAFQRLCPLSSGYATIDWRVEGSKFQRQQIPPCEVRHKIGDLIKRTVSGLKARENGNRRPGWQISGDSQEFTKVFPDGISKTHDSVSQLKHRRSTASLATRPDSLGPHSLYSSSDQCQPMLYHTLPAGAQQTPVRTRHQIPAAGLQYGLLATSSIQRAFSSESNVQHVSGDRICDTVLPPRCSYDSPIPPYCHTQDTLSQLSESITKTPPLSLENETNFWAIDMNRPSSIAPSTLSTINGAYDSSGMYQTSVQHTSATTPSRYKTRTSSLPNQMTGRSYDPARRLAYLRSVSYSTPTTYAPSVASLTPSESVTNRNSLRRDSTMTQDVAHAPSYRHSSFQSASGPNVFSQSSIQNYAIATPHASSAIEPSTVVSSETRIGSAVPRLRSHTTFVRAMNNYKVDAYAFDSAEHVSLKSRPGQMHSLSTEAHRDRGPARWKSEGALHQHNKRFIDDVRGDETAIGPFMRFQHPRTGKPRLTIYETIEAKEGLEKLNIEGQGRGDRWQRRPLTMYETIEERETLDGRIQRGAYTSVENNWVNYF